jgi:hypothetical protein
MAGFAGEDEKKKCAQGVRALLETEETSRVRCALIEPGLVFETLVKLLVGHSSATEENTAARETVVQGFT